MRTSVILLILSLFILSCQNESEKSLPILGNHEINGTDTLYHKIPPFNFVNQNNKNIDNNNLAEYIYISDFFFMSCPSICPKVKKQMLRIYDKHNSNDLIKFVSHTIDPKRDTPERLKMYADNLEVNHDKWYFLSGSKDSLLDMAEAYFVAAYEDPDAPGGFDHSGKILLVDTNGYIRAFCDGTDKDEVDAFMRDIDKLVAEYASR